jgi:predicted DNA-binding protein with PD1-like motif
MQASEGKIGRVFTLRLDDGDAIPLCIESFASERGIRLAQVVLLGGVGSGDVVSGPRTVDMPPRAMLLPVDGVHEVLGAGLLAPDEAGHPKLHIHGALGRAGTTLTGCLREGVQTWFMVEAIVTEILDDKTCRKPDPASGLSILNFGD